MRLSISVKTEATALAVRSTTFLRAAQLRVCRQIFLLLRNTRGAAAEYAVLTAMVSSLVTSVVILFENCTPSAASHILAWLALSTQCH